MSILVTGARGRVGSAVVRGLLRTGIPVRAGGRETSARGLPGGAVAVRIDLARPETFAPALDGVTGVFLYAVPQGAAAFADAAVAAGVEHIVVLSSNAVSLPGAEHHLIARMHAAVEAPVAESGLAWTFLRPGSFAANALLWGASIAATDVVRTAYPGSHSAPVHELDVAEVAVAAFTSPWHRGAVYELTGPGSLTRREQAALIGEAIGRPVRCERIELAQARAELVRVVPPEIADLMLEFEATQDGKPVDLLDTVEQVTGRPATTFARWAADHAADFTGNPEGTR